MSTVTPTFLLYFRVVSTPKNRRTRSTRSAVVEWSALCTVHFPFRIAVLGVHGTSNCVVDCVSAVPSVSEVGMPFYLRDERWTHGKRICIFGKYIPGTPFWYCTVY
jgi:hypothetical protein